MESEIFERYLENLIKKKLINMDDLAKEMGFKGLKEMNHLICEVDLSTPEKRGIFEKWKLEDGTKNGLLKILEKK